MAAEGISDLLRRLQASFHGLDRADGYELTATWVRERSGSTFYRMTAQPSGQDIVVKTLNSWGPGDAKRTFEAMAELAETLDGAAIRPLAWSDDPPLLVMPYTEGIDVVSILRQPDHSGWAHLPTWMERAGSMLAAYHTRYSTSPQEEISSAGEEARSLAARYRIEGATVDRILQQQDWRHRCARSFGDFGPGNLLGTPEGDLYLLDPPDISTTALIHRDLANFLFELRRQLAGRGFTRSHPVPGRFEQLRSSFIDGYSAARYEKPLDVGDHALIALFEMRRAVGMARKRFPNRPGDALWFARSALARRREFSRLADQS